MPGRAARKRNIVAMGGGGFSEEPKNRLLDDYVLALTGKKKPKVCFIPTASGDAQGYIEKFHRAFPARRARASSLTLFRHPGVGDMGKFLLVQDVIYVGGGSTANMLAVWRVHGLDRILRKAWRAGVVLAGVSAGMICWFEQSVTDSFGGRLAPLKDGLGLLKGSACPHYDSPKRRRAYRRLVAGRVLVAGFAADDGAALHFVGGRLASVVSSRPEARAWRVESVRGKAVQTLLQTRYLGKAK